MAAVAVAGNIQERRGAARIVAEIGERRRFQADQRGQFLFGARTFIRGLRRQRRNPVRAGVDGGDALATWLGGLPLHKALVRGRETVLELRRREAIVERVPGRLRIGRYQAGARRRLAALSENER